MYGSGSMVSSTAVSVGEGAGGTDEPDETGDALTVTVLVMTDAAEDVGVLSDSSALHPESNTPNANTPSNDRFKNMPVDVCTPLHHPSRSPEVSLPIDRVTSPLLFSIAMYQ
jgi:hypothetical protein